MQNNTHALTNRFWDRFLKLTQMLVLIALVRSDSLQYPCPPSLLKRQIQKQEESSVPWSIRATIRFPAPTVLLQGPAGDRLTVVTKDDGAFVFDQVAGGNCLSGHRHR